MEKVFNTFNDGLVALVSVSFSAAAALEAALKEMYSPKTYYEKGELPAWTAALEEREVALALAGNGLFRPTKNGVDWSGPTIIINSWGVDYTTRGGLCFGWEVRPSYTTGDKVFAFFVRHYSVSNNPNSTLRAALLAAGWQFEDGEIAP